jgi:hypothetical protein
MIWDTLTRLGAWKPIPGQVGFECGLSHQAYVANTT